MRTHGGASAWRISGAEQELASAASNSQPRAQSSERRGAGFSHFIGTPGQGERFKLDGTEFDPVDAAAWTRAEQLVQKLAHLFLHTDAAPNEFEDGLKARYNRRIPSGYTYFLQLIAHDLVQSSILLSRNKGQTHGISNTRTLPLRLETIYGGGPLQCPTVYQPNGLGFRTHLRLGNTRKSADDFLRTGAKMDIARATVDLPQCPMRAAYPEALVSDMRNDSHAIVSQMTVLFHILHNAIADQLAAGQKLPSTGNQFADAQHLFGAAQSACIIIYRNLIRRDLLPRLLHSAVVEAYETARVPVCHVWKGSAQNAWMIPVEFSSGFFRFGHSMIREMYAFNKLTPFEGGSAFPIDAVLSQNSEKSPEKMPFEKKWIADWEYFFGDNPQSGNFSIRIRPQAHYFLEDAIRGGATVSNSNLIERDLLSSMAVRPWSLRGIVEQLAPTHGALLKMSPFLKASSDEISPNWSEAISKWMTERAAVHPDQSPTEEDIGYLSDDPPIPFFVRFEAGQDPEIRGKHLGVISSIVVADIIYGVFEQDKILGIDGKPELPKQLAGLSAVMTYGKDDSIYSFIPDIVNFQTLRSFLGERVAFPE